MNERLFFWKILSGVHCRPHCVFSFQKREKTGASRDVRACVRACRARAASPRVKISRSPTRRTLIPIFLSLPHRHLLCLLPPASTPPSCSWTITGPSPPPFYSRCIMHRLARPNRRRYSINCILSLGRFHIHASWSYPGISSLEGPLVLARIDVFVRARLVT